MLVALVNGWVKGNKGATEGSAHPNEYLPLGREGSDYSKEVEVIGETFKHLDKPLLQRFWETFL